MTKGTHFTRRRALALIGGATLAAPTIARAQAPWPTRSVRYMLGFAAGGATDTLSRLFCQKMSDLTGQQFVVENRGGAGGVLGADAIAKAAPDGYTLGMGSVATNAIAVGTYAKLPFQAGRDFTFISGLWQLPNVLVVRKDLRNYQGHPSATTRLRDVFKQRGETGAVGTVAPGAAGG